MNENIKTLEKQLDLIVAFLGGDALWRPGIEKWILFAEPGVKPKILFRLLNNNKVKVSFSEDLITREFDLDNFSEIIGYVCFLLYPIFRISENKFATINSNDNWTNFEKLMARTHLNHYGCIFLDENHIPIENNFEEADKLFISSIRKIA